MRLRPRRRNLVIWSAAACRAEQGHGLWFTRPARSRRIRRRMRTLALLVAIGVVRLGAVARPRWRPLLAGTVLTAAGVVLRGSVAGIVMIPGMLSLAYALLVPVDPMADSPRRRELERELAAYCTPAQRCDLEATLDRYPDSVTRELRDILVGQAMAADRGRAG